MIQVPAVFENGMLKLLAPVNLTEGQKVVLNIQLTGRERLEELWSRPSPFPLTPELLAFQEQIKAAKSFEEFMQLIPTAPGDPEPFDLEAELNANRKLSGDIRMLFPEKEAKEAS